MRILVSTNAPWCHTGYGNQSRLLMPRLKGLGHDVAGHFWFGLQGGMLNMGDIPLYPGHQHPYGNDIVVAHAKQFKADAVITLIDAWVLDAEYPAQIKWCPWFPIDAEPIPPPVLARIKDAYLPIVYSRFAERMCHDAGIEVAYVPHGVVTTVFCPGPQKEAREHLDWPADAFIFGMVAANKGHPSRKALVEHMEAFAHLSRCHSDARLYIHTNKNGHGGVNLPEVAEHLGITDKMLWPDDYGYILGFPDGRMVDVYRGLDCLLSVSLGEGFGIPIIEAQACGTPVIVGDWTSMGELCYTGWRVPKPGKRSASYGWIDQGWMTPLAARQFYPMIADILDWMEEAYQTALGFDPQGIAAAVAHYDADHVAETFWRPTLDRIAARIETEREIEVAV